MDTQTSIIKKFDEMPGMERIKIKSLKIQGMYTFTNGSCTDDKCSLCKQCLTGPSFDDLQREMLNVQVVMGKCDHCFHKSCMEAWQDKGFMTCPIDSTPWTIASEHIIKNKVANHPYK
jgi:hypothetical protein